MSAYVLTPLAKADIFEVWCYIAEDSETAADRVEQAIYDACAFFAEDPLRGHTRRDLTQRTLRFWTLSRYPNYTIVHRPETAPLQIVAVLNGKRNLRRILQQPVILCRFLDASRRRSLRRERILKLAESRTVTHLE